MRTWLAAAILCAGGTVPAFSDSPAAPPAGDLCKVPHNAITGPNTHGRAFPLLKGDPAHPKVACMVSWTTLSPDNHPLTVQGCFDGKLLQLPNDSACGRDTGPLWVERRWVVTSADRPAAKTAAASCQELDTSTVAATRDFRPECLKDGAAPKGDGAAKSTPRAFPDASGPAPPPVAH